MLPFLSLSLLLTRSLALILAGQYEFWDYYGEYLHDYSGNLRHAVIASPDLSSILTDRGLYISNGYILQFAKNTYKDFPTSCTDMVISVLFYPQIDKNFCLIKLITSSNTIRVCFENLNGKITILIEGILTNRVETNKSFNVWRLYTVRFSQSSSDTILHIYLDGDDTNTAAIFTINYFSFTAIDTRWELGSDFIEGFLYQIWWHCQVSVSITTLSSGMFNTATSPCVTIYATTPFKRCLSNELDKFKNSESEDCNSCTANNQSCNQDQVCIYSCLYMCIDPQGCRSVSYPICSSPAPSYCTSIPGTDFCTQCNKGWVMSTITPGLCNITVQGCKTFNSNAECTECLEGYYRTLTNPTACIQCPDGCEACIMMSSDVIICTRCPTGEFIHTSPLCVKDCPLGYYGSTYITPNKCLTCTPNCKSCILNTNIINSLCSECNQDHYLQPNYQNLTVQCKTDCPSGHYPDFANPPILCKRCRDYCEVCTNSSDCSRCYPGYILSSDDNSCIFCMTGCRVCINPTQCSLCADGFWLDQSFFRCNQCSPNCKICSNESNCDTCKQLSDGYDEVVINGLRTCRLLCSKQQYVFNNPKSCVEYSSDRLQVTICSEDSNRIVTCSSCLTSDLNQGVCTATICPYNCNKCSTIAGVVICTSCNPSNYLQPDKLSCKETCPGFYFSNWISRLCLPCISKCQKCQNDIHKCEECGEDYSLSLDRTGCVLNCPNNQFTDKTGIWICKSCILNCDVCTSSSNCLRCSNSFYLVTSSTGEVSCQTACPPRNYFDANNVCYSCMDNCDVCVFDNSGKLVCSTCSTGFILINRKCVELKCDPNCLDCILSSTVLRCNLCREGYFIDLYNYKCLSSCPEKYYPDTGTKRCVSCMPDCEICIEVSMSKATCTLCRDSYIFNSLTGVNLCEYTTCPVSCTDCTITSLGIICNTCNNGYYMQPKASICETLCPKFYYADSMDNTCKLCPSFCEECDMNGCIKCVDGYYIQPNLECDFSCPDTYYKDDLTGICKECSLNNCLKCELVDGTALCVECNSATYLRLDRTCDIICEDGYYPDILTQKCLISIPDLLNCLEYDTNLERPICIECIEGYILDSYHKCSLCDSDYVEVSSNPLECAYRIHMCISYQVYQGDWVCMVCEKGYILDNKMKCRRCSEIYQNESTEVLECTPNSDTRPEGEDNADSSGEEKEDSLSLEEEGASYYIIQNSSTITKVATSIGVCASMLSLNVESIFSIIGSAQIYSYLLLYNFNVPNKPYVILQGISIINIVPNIFEYFITAEDTLSIPRYNALDINSEVFLLNSGKMITVLLLSILGILLVKLINQYTKKLNNRSYIKNSVSKLLSSIEWNFLIGSLIQSTLEFSISSLINIYYFSFYNTHAIISFFISIGVFILVILSPIFLTLYLIKNYDKIQDGSLITKYSILYQNLNTHQVEILLFDSILIIRRIVFGVSIVILCSSPYIQVIINSILSCFILCFIKNFKPFIQSLDNIMALYMELNTFAVFSLIGIFIYEDLPEYLYDTMEWTLVVLIYMSILVPAIVNLSLLIYKIIRSNNKQSEININDIKVVID